MRGWSIGIVGAGEIVQKMHLPVLCAMEGVRVAWVADANGALARRVAHAFRVAPAPDAEPGRLPACDAVLLAIPVGVRAPFLEELARRGTAVLAEKPFAVSEAEHRRFLSLFPEPRLGCAFMRRTYASSVLLRRVVAEGWFGPLRGVRLSEGGRKTKTGVAGTFHDDRAASGGGVLMDLGVHALDLMLHVTGAREYEILESRSVTDGGIDRKVAARIGVRGEPGGAAASFECHFAVSGLDPQANRIDLEFSSCTVGAGTRPEAPVEIAPAGGGGVVATLEGRAAGATTSYQAFFLEWDAFLRGVSSNEASLVSAASALMTSRLVEDLYRRESR